MLKMQGGKGGSGRPSKWPTGFLAPGLAVILVITLLNGLLGAQEEMVHEPIVNHLGHLIEMRDRVRDIHPAFQRLQPVAIAVAGEISVYEPDESDHGYRFAAMAPDRFNLPVGVRAAMPLDFWDGRMACVVTPGAFHEIAGYVTVFHEFVHCYQWETCELGLKDSLSIYREAMEREDYMWEIMFPFPYQDSDFVRDYRDMLAALETDDLAEASRRRRSLQARLSNEQWQYMTWQEWKEGSARFLENRVRERLGLALNVGGREPPFTRVSFYAGGDALIQMLASEDPELPSDLSRLYHRIIE